MKVLHNHVLFTVYFDTINKCLGLENNRPQRKLLVSVFLNGNTILGITYSV